MPTLEERVTRLEELVSEQQSLRVGQDEDLSGIGIKLKARDGLLEGLAKTQSEHTATLAKHTATLDRHTAILDRHTAMHRETNLKLAQHTAELFLLKDGVEQIIGMLSTLIERDGGR